MCTHTRACGAYQAAMGLMEQNGAADRMSARREKTKSELVCSNDSHRKERLEGEDVGRQKHTEAARTQQGQTRLQLHVSVPPQSGVSRRPTGCLVIPLGNCALVEEGYSIDPSP